MNTSFKLYMVCCRYPIGTRGEVILKLSQSCCEDAASVHVQDLAGNTAICNYGPVPSSASQSLLNMYILFKCFMLLNLSV